ncbi:MAG: hypothetical protein CHACPFDD_00330 [Phycisphaerae bacterium]|nr:hypothetical protein [Phycisphaerae bacterium]
MVFRWDDRNLEHVPSHGVTPGEAEYVVSNTGRLYPLHRADDKWLAWGQAEGGRMVQVVFVLDADEAVYIIHARPLTEREKIRFRRRRR